MSKTEIVDEIDDGDATEDHRRFEKQHSQQSNNDQLERCGRWLASIPRDDVAELRNTVEFRDFLRAFENLGRAHLGVVAASSNQNQAMEEPEDLAIGVPNEKRKRRNNEISCNNCNENGDSRSKDTPEGTEENGDIDASHCHHGSRHNGLSYTTTTTGISSTINSNGNHLLRFTDDILLRILEFLKCRCMIQTSLTCSRFRQLVSQSAIQRTHTFAKTRQLGNVLQLLRAREQIYHINDAASENCSVPVPLLLPGRRVLVTNAGDPDYNGVYHCTDCNGNGFVFTKPRYSCNQQTDSIQQAQPERMVLDNEGQQANNTNNNDNNNNNNVIQRAGPLPLANHNEEEPRTPRRSREESSRSELSLRCVIAKAYSNHDVFWYMSKEIETTTETNDSSWSWRPRMYSFYAPLMLAANAPPGLAVYPSQTSVLFEQNQAWGNLRATTDGLRAPTLQVLSESGCQSTSMVLEN